MNQYGAMAMSHWGRYLPTRFSQIEDPVSFFSTLGEQVEEQIDQLSDQLAGIDPPGEDYLGKVGRLNAARQQAREQVLAEQVLLPAEPGSEMDEDSEQPATEPDEQGWVPVTEDPNHPWWREHPET